MGQHVAVEVGAPSDAQPASVREPCNPAPCEERRATKELQDDDGGVTELQADSKSTMPKSSRNALSAGQPTQDGGRSPGLAFDWFSLREAVIAAAAIAAAVVAVWMTLGADFLEYEGWLAAQKADLVLGPVLSGLYWLRRRPQCRFGLVLIAVGFLSVPYILQSSPVPWAFGVGVLWEGPISVATFALILAFPTGRLDGIAERMILAAAVLGIVVPLSVVVLVAPELVAGAAISGCSGACPANGLLVSPNAELAAHLIDVGRITIAVLDLATMAVIVSRFHAGTPPRRRALAIGAAIALVFLAAQFAYQSAQLLELDSGPVHSVAVWTLVAARSALWYGFLLALVAAELFAGRVLRRVVGETLRRPPLREIEAMLRAPLGDPQLRLLFWRPSTREWVDGDNLPQEPSEGQVLTAIRRDGRAAVAILHDRQLAENPELVHAAGAVALLTHENAELERAWTDSLRELKASRARIATAGDIERQSLERDLHDGAQQQLTASLIKLALVGELLPRGSVAHSKLAGLETDLEHTLRELRRLAHGIYPARLTESGLVGALEAVAARSDGAVEVVGDGIGRYGSGLESAVYFCCMEALQNATKHAGPGVKVSIRLHMAANELHFEVRDNGRGFDPDAVHDGVGLHNMRDRLAALHGRLEIRTAPGRGAVVSGAVPVV